MVLCMVCYSTFDAFQQLKLLEKLTQHQRLLLWFHDIRICPRNCINYSCRKCTTTFGNVTYASLHIINCYHKNYVEHNIAIYLNLSTDIQINPVCLFKSIPHVFCFKIDYNEILRDFIINNKEEITRNHCFISSSLSNFRDIFTLISRHNVFCPFCNMAFDVFPSIEVVVSHFEKYHEFA